MRLLSIFFTLFLLFVLLAACSEKPVDTAPVTKTAPREVRTLPRVLPPDVEREGLGEILHLNTPPSGGDFITTTTGWSLELIGSFSTQPVKEGDWVDLIIIRFDEENVFQYLCTAETYSCQRIFRMRRTDIPQGENAPSRTP